MTLSRLQKTFYTLAGLGGLWAVFLGTLLHPSVQRFALYAHRFHTLWLHDIDKPHSFGFAERQVTPFRIQTEDGESLYAWHILPLGVYAEHEAEIMSEPAGFAGADGLGGVALGLLRDQGSRLIINCTISLRLASSPFPASGTPLTPPSPWRELNAGHLAQGFRPAAYKALSSADSTARTHILTFDYRGFGKSTGTPSEEGLIRDGRAVVRWATESAGIDPSRIVLLGHSLGSAVATAVASDEVARSEHFPFAGLLLTSGFSDVPNLMKTYAFGGFVPILSPLSGYPWLQGVLTDMIVDTWNTTARLRGLSGVQGLKVHLFHARNDRDIGWRHSDLLFDALSSSGLQGQERQIDSSFEEVEHGEAMVKTNDARDGGIWVRRSLLPFGGHNIVVCHAPVALAVRRFFEMQEASNKAGR